LKPFFFNVNEIINADEKIWILICLASISIAAFSQEHCPVIPAPLKFAKVQQEFRLTPKTVIFIAQPTLQKPPIILKRNWRALLR